MIILPIEVVLLILENLDDKSLRSLSATCSTYRDAYNKFLYSVVDICESYTYSNRFPKTYKFFSLAHKRSLPVKKLRVHWDYPKKVDRGFDDLVPLLRMSFLRMRELKYISLNIRIRDKDFEKVFVPNCTFKVCSFKCNFGDKKKIEAFLSNHMDF